MTKTYRAALIGCSRMGAFIDNEVAGNASVALPYSHAAGYEACPRTQLIAGSDVRQDVLDRFGERYGVAQAHRYVDYRALLSTERPEIVSIATQPEQRAEIIESWPSPLTCTKWTTLSSHSVRRRCIPKMYLLALPGSLFITARRKRRWIPSICLCC